MRGDHIKILRYGFFYHHAIDLGNGKVVQYRGEIIKGKDPKTSIVGINSISDFIRFSGSEIEVVEYINDKIFEPDEVIRRAKSRLGENKYNILFNNCEHFCYWCKTGKSKCMQIKTILNDLDSVLKNKNKYLESLDYEK